jgi:hypothetical protein
LEQHHLPKSKSVPLCRRGESHSRNVRS